MKTEEVKTLLEAQMPESGQYIKPFVEDEHEGPGPGPTLQCSSPEYKALYVAWPFKAPPRGQTSMPLFIARLIDGLPTAEERTDAKLLWNRSLPVAANVGIIEYNRVDGPVFREKMGNRYGEGWCRALENLARNLNEAAEVVVGKKTQPKPDNEATEAAMSLLSISTTPQTPASHRTTSPETLVAATNPLSALWYLVDRFFSSGYPAASYFFVALEATIRLDKPTVVQALNIPAPPAFWTSAANWRTPKVGMTLLLTLASSQKYMFDAFAQFSKSLGKPAATTEDMLTKPSASLRKAVLRAKADARDKQRTTVLGVDLRDVRYIQLCEILGNEAGKQFATFARMFVLGICPEGAKLWLVGGEWGETWTVGESNDKSGPAVGTWEEMDEFEQWNSKRFKWYHRCFAVDLKQFNLEIDEEERKKRGLQKKEGTKRLLNKIGACVEIFKIADVKMEDVGKFSWLL